MVLTFAHPDLEAPRFVRRFAALVPHTTGRARSCESCHRSAEAVGLGRGRIARTTTGLAFNPVGAPREDGLAEDAWTSLDAAPRPVRGPRPFDAGEIRRILRAPIDVR